MGRSVGTTAAVGVCSVALLACGGGASPRQPNAGGRDPLDLAVVAVDARIGDAEAHASGVVIDADGGLVVKIGRAHV